MHFLTTDDDSGSAWSERYQQGYHSRFGALTQARWVYLEASGVGARLRARQPSAVLEIGFGLGLNALVTADCATTAGTRLHYHAIENDPVSATMLSRLGYRRWLNNATLADTLEQGLAPKLRDSAQAPWKSNGEGADPILDHLARNSAAGTCEEQTVTLSPRITLRLTHADATGVAFDDQRYDAVYLDPFSPNVNPECWSQDFLARVHQALKPGGKLTTYSVKGEVRRTLQAVGFDVGKCPGPPGKREMLRASRIHL